MTRHKRPGAKELEGRLAQAERSLGLHRTSQMEAAARLKDVEGELEVPAVSPQHGHGGGGGAGASVNRLFGLLTRLWGYIPGGRDMSDT